MAFTMMNVSTPVQKIYAPVTRARSLRASALRPSVAPLAARAKVSVGLGRALPGRMVVRADAAPAPPPAVLPPPANFQNVVNLGVGKANLPVPKIFAMGIMAGIFIGFGAYLAATVGGNCPGLVATNPGLQKIVQGAFGLPFGLLMVLTVGAELFTGNTALVTAAVLEKKASWADLAKSWIVSYAGNFVGSLILAYMVFESGLFGATSPPVAIAVAKTSQTFAQAFFRGILCNILVCIAIVQASAANSFAGKALAVWFPISSFIALGLEHSVANMFLIPMGIMLGAKVTWTKFLMANLLPVTLGNIVGGALFVAIAYSYIFGTLGKKA